jgi:hypothetical protein
MTHAEEILLAAVALSQKNTHGVFTRDDVRRFIGVTRTVWLSGYTAIFQGMRIDQPGGAPPVGLSGVFRRIARGRYQLTARGTQLADKPRR